MEPPTGVAPEFGGTFRIRDFELDVAAYELRRDGHRVRLERQPLDVLILLVGRRGQLVSRSEIADALWGKDVFVDVENGVNTAIRKARWRCVIHRTRRPSSRRCPARGIASLRPSRSWVMLLGPRHPRRHRLFQRRSSSMLPGRARACAWLWESSSSRHWPGCFAGGGSDGQDRALASRSRCCHSTTSIVMRKRTTSPVD